MASQLRPITLLNTDYKLHTKVYMARLLQVLPKVLAKGQLCLVRGKNIMQGAILLWSTAQFDLLIIDTVCRQFEVLSGAILNRSHKAAILGLGTGLAGRPGHCLGLVPRSPWRPLGHFCPFSGGHCVSFPGGLPGQGAGGHPDGGRGGGYPLPERE